MTKVIALILSSSAFAHGHTFTTINPGGTYAPVTVTSQYQPIPTYISSASSYNTYIYVSTTISDADRKNAIVTNIEQPIIFHHQKYTLTHTKSYTRSGPTEAARPKGDGYSSYIKNTTLSPSSHIWTELHEKIDEAPYRDLGPSALPAYTGSGLCTKKCHGEDNIIYQPTHVSEYTNGQWTRYKTTYTYGVPTPSVTTYTQPGKYTIPKYDMTIHHTTTVAAEATYTARPSRTVTYGGSLTELHEPCTVTAHYGAYSVTTSSGKQATKTIIQTTTIRADKPGTYTIAPPTTTWYANEQICTFPTISVYPPGVYRHTKETVEITKTKQAYTCRYQTSSVYHKSKTSGKDTHTTTSALPTSKVAHSVTQSSSYFSSSSSSSMLSHTNGTSYHTTSSPPAFYQTISSQSSIYSHPTSSPTTTTPYNPDPSSDPAEGNDPIESYGTAASAGYVKRGGVLERRKVGGGMKAKSTWKGRVVLV